MRILKQSTATDILVLMVDSTDHVTGKTGLTLTITASKGAAAFASITPTVTERGNGWYALALTTSHTDTLGDLGFHVTGAAADPADFLCRVVAGALDADVSTRALEAGGNLATVLGDTNDLQTRVPAALVSGRMDASVGAMAAGVVTAAAVATDAIDGDAIAATAVSEIQSGLATAAALATVQADTDDIQTRLPAALVSGRMSSYVGAMAGDIIAAATIAADAIAEIQSGLATAAALATVQADTDNIQTRIPAALVGGRMDSNVQAIANDILTAAALAADAIAEIQSGLATSAALAAAQGDVTLIKAKTDNLPSGIKKNTALAKFSFLMLDSTDHVTPKTGLTGFTAQRSLDGVAFAACANAVTELANGVYLIDLAAGDLNGDVITLRFVATGGDPCILTVITEP